MKTITKTWHEDERDEEGKVIATHMNIVFKFGVVTGYESETIYPKKKKNEKTTSVSRA